MVFAIDQVNALENNDEGPKPASLWKWICSFSSASSHKRILSTSTNNHHYLELHQKARNLLLMDLLGRFPSLDGLGRLKLESDELKNTEMVACWMRNFSVYFRAYNNNNIEDITGCIPLILENPVRRSPLSGLKVAKQKINMHSQILRDIYFQVQTFIIESLANHSMNAIRRKSLSGTS